MTSEHGGDSSLNNPSNQPTNQPTVSQSHYYENKYPTLDFVRPSAHTHTRKIQYKRYSEVLPPPE